MKTITKLWGRSCFDRYAFGFLIAIELLMSFTYLGYIHIPPISVTIAYLPILAAGCLFGPVQSVTVGFVFGAASIYKASASYVLPADAAFSPFFSGAPFNSLLLGIGTRMLFGLIVGIVFQFAKKRKHCRLWFGVISAVAPKMHSLFVYTAMGIFFPELGYRYSSAFRFDLDDAFFILICVLLIELLWAVYQSAPVQSVKDCMDQSVNNPYTSRKMTLFLILFEFFLSGMAVFAAVYFSQRESYMLEAHGIQVSFALSADLLLLQIQFLIAMLALNIISVILLISVYKYMSYKEYQGDMDALTNVMGRRMFLSHCEKAQKAKAADSGQTGWFLFVDVDYFKAVNDTFGHSVGDQVLKEIAGHLQNIFEDSGKVGRLGGDEFAVIIEKEMPSQELERRLDHFLTGISGTLPHRNTSCSIGAYQFVFPKNVKFLLTETDHILYKAKENGRACYVIRTCTPNEPKTSI